jgi:hypothetical protein
MDAFLKLREELSALLKFRNTLAHDVFIGQHEGGNLLFSVPSSIAADQPAISVADQPAIIAVPATAVYEIRSLPPTSIIQMANQVGPHLLQVMQQMFALEAPRLTHLARSRAPESAPPTPQTEKSPIEGAAQQHVSVGRPRKSQKDHASEKVVSSPRDRIDWQRDE